jgi:FeoA domain
MDRRRDPTLDGSLPVDRSQTLVETPVNEKVQVASVSDRDPEILRYLGLNRIKPGVRLKIVEQLPFRGAYRVMVGASVKAILLSESLAGAVVVSALSE